MKNINKIFLIIGMLLLIFTFYQGASSYAKYISLKKQDATAEFESWHIEVNDTDIENNKVFDLPTATILTVGANSEKYSANTVIAPGKVGYFDISVDYTNVSVPFQYNIYVDGHDNNRNIITYVRELNTSDTEAMIINDLNNYKNAPIDINNPMINNVDVSGTNRELNLRVYVIWKNDSNNNFIDTLSEGHDLSYVVSLKFKQLLSMDTITDSNYDLNINGRSNIIDNDSDGMISMGDIVSLNGQEFYVLSTNNTYNSVRLLAKYNLDVMNDGIQNVLCTGSVDLVSNGSCTLPFYEYVNSYEGSGSSGYPATKYSYWANIGKDSKDLFVYYNSSTLYSYLDKYQDYFFDIGYKSVRTSLLNIYDIDNVCVDDDCTAPSWLYDTSYWTGIAENSSQVKVFGKNSFYGCDTFDESNKYGIRPVVEMYAKEI